MPRIPPRKKSKNVVSIIGFHNAGIEQLSDTERNSKRLDQSCERKEGNVVNSRLAEEKQRGCDRRVDESRDEDVEVSIEPRRRQGRRVASKIFIRLVSVLSVLLFHVLIFKE